VTQQQFQDGISNYCRRRLKFVCSTTCTICPEDPSCPGHSLFKGDTSNTFFTTFMFWRCLPIVRMSVTRATDIQKRYPQNLLTMATVVAGQWCRHYATRVLPPSTTTISAVLVPLAHHQQQKIHLSPQRQNPSSSYSWFSSSADDDSKLRNIGISAHIDRYVS
jgi:hypothetical protein